MTGNAKKIVHIPYVLYHNFIEESKFDFEEYIAGSAKQNLKCIKEHFKAKDMDVSYSESAIPGIYIIAKNYEFYEKISIIIPFKDKISLLKKCINSIREMTSYPDYEIVLVPNNCEEPESFEYLEKIKSAGCDIEILEYNKFFNFSSLHNEVVNEVKGKIYCC